MQAEAQKYIQENSMEQVLLITSSRLMIQQETMLTGSTRTDDATDTITNIYTETNVNGKIWIPKSINGYLVEKIGDAKNEIGSKVNLLGKVVTDGNEIMSEESKGITALVIPDSIRTIGAACINKYTECV